MFGMLQMPEKLFVGWMMLGRCSSNRCSFATLCEMSVSIGVLPLPPKVSCAKSDRKCHPWNHGLRLLCPPLLVFLLGALRPNLVGAEMV